MFKEVLEVIQSDVHPHVLAAVQESVDKGARLPAGLDVHMVTDMTVQTINQIFSYVGERVEQNTELLPVTNSGAQISAEMIIGAFTVKFLLGGLSAIDTAIQQFAMELMLRNLSGQTGRP